MSKADPPMPDPSPSNPPPPAYTNPGLLPTIAAPPSGVGVGPMPHQAPIQTHYSPPPPQPMPTTICPYCSMQLAYPHGAQLIICPGCRRTSQLTIVPRLQMNCTRCTTLLYYAPIYQLIQCPTCQLVIQPPHVTPIHTTQPPPPAFNPNPQLQVHQLPINPSPAPAPLPTSNPVSTISSPPPSSHPSQHQTPRPAVEGKERDEWDARHGPGEGGHEIEMKDMSGRAIAADDVSLEIEGSAAKSSLVENLKKQQAKKKAQSGGYQPLLHDED